jgi:hypothetical protein
MQFRAKEKGLNVTEIPITTWYEDKAKRSPVAHGLGVLTRILSLINQRHPLLCLSLPGAILLLAGIILGLIGFRNYNAPISLPLGQAFASALLCAIGLLVLFAGIMLHWLRNFLELGQGK